MKITVRHNDTEIHIDESDNPSTDKGSIKWNTAGIQVIIEKIVQQIMVLTNPK